MEDEFNQIETEDQVAVEPIEAEPPEAPAPEPEKRMSIKESIQDALRQRDEKTGQFKPAAKPEAVKPSTAAKPAQKAGEVIPPQGNTEVQPPDAWKSKEWKPLWESMPPQVRQAISKREADMQKGVDQLKTRYQELEGAVAPYRENIKRFGFTEGQAVDQLFKWQMALAGPQKLQAFVALMQSHGVDPATFAAALAGNATQASQGGLPMEVKQAIDGINSKLSQYDQHFATQTKGAAEQTVSSWAKDKPHYNAVRFLMGQLIQSGAAKPSEGDPFALDAAYNMAIYATPETRDAIAVEQRAKEAAERKAVADKARKAGSSMRTGAPVAPAAPQPNGKAKTESARESITRALAELRQ